jgi:hypothetical protein
MKKLSYIASVLLCVILLFAAIPVSAGGVMTISSKEPVDVYLTIEGPDGLYAFTSGTFPGDGSVSASSAIETLVAKNYPDMEITGLSDGFITSINGISYGTFGGWDGWLYLIKHITVDENGKTQYVNEVPPFGLNDYMIEDSLQIIVYYGDYDDAIAGYTNVDGMVKLVQYTPLYEDYLIIDFIESPLSGGSIDLTPILVDELTGESTYGETISFVADDQGMTTLDAEFRAVQNGQYLVSIGKQSSETAEVGDVILSKPEAARHTFKIIVENKPTPEELFIRFILILLIGVFGRKG